MVMFHSHVELPKGISSGRITLVDTCRLCPAGSTHGDYWAAIFTRSNPSWIGSDSRVWDVVGLSTPVVGELSSANPTHAHVSHRLFLHSKQCGFTSSCVSCLCIPYPYLGYKALIYLAQNMSVRLDVFFFAVVDPISQQTNTHSRASDKPHHQGVELVPWYSPASAWTWNQAAEPVQRGWLLAIGDRQWWLLNKCL